MPFLYQFTPLYYVRGSEDYNCDPSRVQACVTSPFLYLGFSPHKFNLLCKSAEFDKLTTRSGGSLVILPLDFTLIINHHHHIHHF